MWLRVIAAVAGAVVLSYPVARAQSQPTRHSDLQGTWSGGTLTPLERPPDFRDRATFTPAEAAEYVRTRADRIRRLLSTDADRAVQSDIDDDSVEIERMPLDGLRTSLIVEPQNGMLPPLLPAAQARARARPPRTSDNPESRNLAERCLLAMPGLGGSLASPPMVPSAAIPALYQIVQTDHYVLIFAEWIHDARVVRMNSAHASPAIRKWLGDSIGDWDRDTLVVDTTNFRPDVRNLGSGERLHVVERFTRIDSRTLRYRVTVEDPETWATAWTAEWPFRAIDDRVFPSECHEGNYSMTNMLRGARAEEQRR
jgi:hypothetical protein